MDYRRIRLFCVAVAMVTAISLAGMASAESLAAMAERAARLEAGGKGSPQLSWQVRDRLQNLVARLEKGDSAETRKEIRSGLSCRHDPGSRLLRAAICAGEAEIAHTMMSREKPKAGALDDRSIWECVAEHPSALIARDLRAIGSPRGWPPQVADLVVKNQAYELFTEERHLALQLAVLNHRAGLAKELATGWAADFQPERALLAVAKEGDAASLEILARLARSAPFSFGVAKEALAEVVCQGDAAKIPFLVPFVVGRESSSGGFEAAGRCGRVEMVAKLLDAGLLPAGGELRTWRSFESLPPGLVRRLAEHLDPIQLTWLLHRPGTRDRLPELAEAVARQEAARGLPSSGSLEYRLLALGYDRALVNINRGGPFELGERDQAGNSGPARAVIRGDWELLDFYRRAGADFSAINAAGQGLLHLAADQGNLDLLEKLLASGIQRKADKAGRMPGDQLWRTAESFGSQWMTFKAATVPHQAHFFECQAEHDPRTFRLQCKQNEQLQRPAGGFTLSIEGRRPTPVQRLKSLIGGRSGQVPRLDQKIVGDRAIATLAAFREGYFLEIRATGPRLLDDEVRSLRDWGLANGFALKEPSSTASPQVKVLRVAFLVGLLVLLVIILALIRSHRS